MKGVLSLDVNVEHLSTSDQDQMVSTCTVMIRMSVIAMVINFIYAGYKLRLSQWERLVWLASLQIGVD